MDVNYSSASQNKLSHPRGTRNQFKRGRGERESIRLKILWINTPLLKHRQELLFLSYTARHEI